MYSALQDVNERLGFYVAACKKTEDERDQLAEELASRTARYKQELSSLKEELSARQSYVFINGCCCVMEATALMLPMALCPAFSCMA